MAQYVVVRKRQRRRNNGADKPTVTFTHIPNVGRLESDVSRHIMQRELGTVLCGVCISLT